MYIFFFFFFLRHVVHFLIAYSCLAAAQPLVTNLRSTCYLLFPLPPAIAIKHFPHFIIFASPFRCAFTRSYLGKLSERDITLLNVSRKLEQVSIFIVFHSRFARVRFTDSETIRRVNLRRYKKGSLSSPSRIIY